MGFTRLLVCDLIDENGTRGVMDVRGQCVWVQNTRLGIEPL